MSIEKTKTMKDLITKEEQTSRLPHTGDLIEGKIIKIGKNAIILEINPFGTGIIYGGEWKDNKSAIKNLKVGDIISTLVLDPENDEGYIELSLKKADIEKTWSELREKQQNKETIEVKVAEANRGGLVIRYCDLIGFLPVSQLSAENYPRVEGGDKNKILQELNKFIGKEITVKIIGLEKRADKFIVSEKATQEKKIKENLDNYATGDVVEGMVTALTDFGAFIKFDDNIEGLAHISELDWQILNHPNQILKENDEVKAKIIDIQNEQVSLSLKALKEDPWQDIDKKYQNGQTIQGQVAKITPNGAFIKIDEGIYGLSPSLENNSLELNESYNFEITSLSPDSHRMSLSLKK